MGGRDLNARAYLGRFNFTGSDQEKKCGMLSGGERNRLHLAMTLREEANVLLAQNPGLIASFSRALLDGLTAQQTDEEFDRTLDASIEAIYRASLT